jgi:hypothetical protein
MLLVLLAGPDFSGQDPVSAPAVVVCAADGGSVVAVPDVQWAPRWTAGTAASAATVGS